MTAPVMLSAVCVCTPGSLSWRLWGWHRALARLLEQWLVLNLCLLALRSARGVSTETFVYILILESIIVPPVALLLHGMLAGE